jgi:hypothetical protein
MINKEILNIKSKFYKKNQFFILGFENNEYASLPFQEISKNTNLEVQEVELLIGSKLNINFYNAGDIMSDGNICNENNILVKEYTIILSKSLENLRQENKLVLKKFTRIKNIFIQNNYGKETIGIEDENKSILSLTFKRFESLLKISKDEFEILLDSFISPEFYEIGEILYDGSIVKKEKCILKDLNLRYSDKTNKNSETTITYFYGKV